ncbi:MAG TPA: ribosome maturation factor RimM [Steroidobacteraceae bacterium]|nr:ribosome maturation factor RimM [Steroidobacteraceae bacterium]
MDWVELGRIGAPFGVKGWTHVDSYTDPPEALLEYPNWVLRVATGQRTTRQVAQGEARGERLVARLEGIEDRDAAAALTGAVIEVKRAELPPPGKRQYYQADLIGLAVRNLEGVELGQVVQFVDAPTGPVMVVKGAGREHWVLATREYLRKVELQEGRILVDWPAELE